MKYRFHITTGDIDGIGLEVTLKSLNTVIKKSSQCHFIVWVHKSQVKIVKKYLNKNQSLIPYIQFVDQKNYNKIKPAKVNFLINQNPTPATWFKDVAKLCLKTNDSVITAPMSKTQIMKEPFKAVGHTEILSQISDQKNLNMVFIGKYFSVILFTGHIPIQKINIDIGVFKNFLQQAYSFHKKFKNPKAEFKILGLNPHAGDQGLIGKDDEKILRVVNKVLDIKFLIPADSAFVNYKGFRFNPTFISMYHDQGLIPFKMAHGYSGFHYTLGLPFIRTSVDHGTAKDIFKLNIANSNSMSDAILGAIKLKKGVL